MLIVVSPLLKQTQTTDNRQPPRKHGTFIHTFEVIANREGWAKPDWAKILAPFLSGEAQRAYYALPAPSNDGYDGVKAEILARTGPSSVGAAQKFCQWAYEEHIPVRAKVAQLSRIVHLWLLANNPTAAQVAEKVVVDCLLQALPRRLRHAVGMRGSASLRELVESVELAEASAAREVGERVGPPPPAAPTPEDEPMPTDPIPRAPGPG